MGEVPEQRNERVGLTLSSYAKDLWYDNSEPLGKKEKSRRLCELVEMGHKVSRWEISPESLDRMGDQGILQMLDAFFKDVTKDEAKIHLVQGIVSALVGSEKVIIGMSESAISEAALNNKDLDKEDKEDKEEEYITSSLTPMSFS